MPEQEVKCTQAARGPLAALAASDQDSTEKRSPSEEVSMITARVGQPAPDFEAMAFQEGGFKLVRLSDFDGQWRLLCFYPGDFTFV